MNVGKRTLRNIHKVTAQAIEDTCCQFGPKISARIVEICGKPNGISSLEELRIPKLIGDKQMKQLTKHFCCRDSEQRVVKYYKLNINNITPDELVCEVHGIGAVFAEKICAMIKKREGIDSIDELSDISGIGEKRMNSLHAECYCGDYVGLEDDEDSVCECNLININTASKVELMRLDQVGSSRADDIIAYRKLHRFAKINDIMKISGISSARFANIRDLICV